MAMVNIYNINMIKKENKKEQDKRHKCSICGKVRFEKFMVQIIFNNGFIMETRYGHQCWCCNNQKCKESTRYFMVY
jgi:hypothetical protein